jgi:hypothetical protein
MNPTDAVLGAESHQPSSGLEILMDGNGKGD